MTKKKNPREHAEADRPGISPPPLDENILRSMAILAEENILDDRRPAAAPPPPAAGADRKPTSGEELVIKRIPPPSFESRPAKSVPPSPAAGSGGVKTVPPSPFKIKTAGSDPAAAEAADGGRPDKGKAGHPVGQSDQPPKAPKRWLAALNVFSQVFILLFMLGWVFILGILIGRGHIWESDIGQNFLVWIEEKAGWREQAESASPPRPEVIAKADEDLLAVTNEPPAAGPWTPGEGAEAFDMGGAGQGAADDITSSGSELVLAPAFQVPMDEEPAEPAAPAAVSEPRRPNAGRAPQQAQQADRTQSAPSWVDAGSAGNTAATANNLPNAFQSQSSAAEASVAAAPPAGAGVFTIQVGETTNENDAKRQVKRLVDIGVDEAYYYQRNANRFPIRVGRFETRQEAEYAVGQLRGLGVKDAFISKLAP